MEFTLKHHIYSRGNSGYCSVFCDSSITPEQKKILEKNASDAKPKEARPEDLPSPFVKYTGWSLDNDAYVLMKMIHGRRDEYKRVTYDAHSIILSAREIRLRAGNPAILLNALIAGNFFIDSPVNPGAKYKNRLVVSEKSEHTVNLKHTTLLKQLCSFLYSHRNDHNRSLLLRGNIAMPHLLLEDCFSLLPVTERINTSFDTLFVKVYEKKRLCLCQGERAPLVSFDAILNFPVDTTTTDHTPDTVGIISEVFKAIESRKNTHLTEYFRLESLLTMQAYSEFKDLFCVTGRQIRNLLISYNINSLIRYIIAVRDIDLMHEVINGLSRSLLNNLLGDIALTGEYLKKHSSSSKEIILEWCYSEYMNEKSKSVLSLHVEHSIDKMSALVDIIKRTGDIRTWKERLIELCKDNRSIITLLKLLVNSHNAPSSDQHRNSILLGLIDRVIPLIDPKDIPAGLIVELNGIKGGRILSELQNILQQRRV